jgi:hemerythrin
VKWSDAYSTGIQLIDDQHRMLFRTVEVFRSALDAGKGEHVYGDLLQTLELYVRTHFSMEEACMARYRCPIGERNRAAHQLFIAVLAGFRDDYAAHGFDRDNARNLTDTVDRWLDDHICRIDVHLRESVALS